MALPQLRFPKGLVPPNTPGIPATSLQPTRSRLCPPMLTPLVTLSNQVPSVPGTPVPIDLLVLETERLIRIFYVLGTIFLHFREATWHMCIRHIKRNDRHVIIDEDERKTDRWNGWWSMFPDHIGLMKDSQCKAAVLMTGACYDSGLCVQLIEQLFEGMHFSFEEVLIRLKPNHARTLLVNSCSSLTSDLTTLDVWVFRMTSAVTKRTWALHLSGAQYHKPDIATFWDDFVHDHVAYILSTKSLGTLSHFAHLQARTKTLSGMQHDLQIRAMRSIHCTVDPAMAKKNLAWKDVLSKPQDDFVRHANKIMGVGRRAVVAFTKDEGALTKRRQKVERYEKRHGDEVGREEKEMSEEILGCQLVRRKREVVGNDEE